MSEQKDGGPAFTLVFDGSLRSFKKNPFATETPFGTPYGAGIGDLMAESAAFRDVLATISDGRMTACEMAALAAQAIKDADATVSAMLAERTKAQAVKE